MTLREFLLEKAKDESQRERWRLREEWVVAVRPWRYPNWQGSGWWQARPGKSGLDVFDRLA